MLLTNSLSLAEYKKVKCDEPVTGALIFECTLIWNTSEKYKYYYDGRMQTNSSSSYLADNTWLH